MCRNLTPEGNETMEKEPREQTTLRLPPELKEKLQNERGNGLECLSY